LGDTTLVKKLPIIKGITYLADAGFRDYSWLKDLIKKEAFFIVRQHKTVYVSVIKDLKLTEEDVISDQIVILGQKEYKMDKKTRLIKFYMKSGEIMLLSTNRFDLTSEEIRDLYRKRWEIEIFFKFLKQNLKLKRFFGTSVNAVKTQIYCALVAYLLCYLIKPPKAHMTEFLRKVRYSLFLDFYQLSFFDDS